MDKYIGIPYKYGGEDFSGADCWGLVRLYLKNELGIVVPRYYVGPYDKEIIGAQIEFSKIDFKAVQMPAIGDIVLMNINGVTSHCGVYCGDGRMLHTLIQHDSACVKIDDPKWIKRIEGYYRAS